MATINKIRHSKFNQTCKCGRRIVKGDIVGIGDNTICYNCARKAICFRLKVLNTWKADKIMLLEKINEWLAKPEVSNEMMLRTIEGDNK
jgi:hypothetical protein